MHIDWTVVIINILYWGMVVACFVIPFIRPRTRAESGTLNSTSGVTYGYAVGDNLQSYPAFGYFNGLDVDLPIDMPHIYLDSRVSGGHRVRAVFDDGQRLQLEGNFNQYFNVFVPKPYEVIALSVLTPDVMAIVIDHAKDFDVEIYGRQLRVITNRKVSKDYGLQDGMLAVAGNILAEIEDRQRGWTHANSVQAYEQDLLVRRSGGFRILGHYVTSKMIIVNIYWLCCLVGLFGASVTVYLQHRYKAAIIIAMITTALFVGLQYLTRYLEDSVRFRARRG